MHVALSRRAQRDIRRLDRTTRHRVAGELSLMNAPNADVKSLVGRPPWRRLRIGDYRVLFRTLDAAEIAAIGIEDDTGILVARIVHRRDLERAVASLP